MTNRFETLLAPTSLTPKDLRIHIRMHPEIPKEVSGACSNELVNVATRMHDELTTVRFGRDLVETPDPDNYRTLVRQLTGSEATPIPYRFFSQEYERSHDQVEAAADTLDMVASFDDPWQVQAWAAQALRVAQNAETEDPDKAATAWKRAINVYTAFFGKTDVTTSYTYQQQGDPQAQDACRQAWDSFLTDEVASLASRITDYSNSHRAEAVQAVQSALSVPEVAARNPKAASQAASAAQDAFLSGINSASDLKSAWNMYSNAPSHSDELDRALLRAMTSETEKLAAGFGDVATIAQCGEALGLRDIPDSEVGSLMRTARNEFYEAAAAFSRTAINDSAPQTVRNKAARVMQLLPPDRTVGTTTADNEQINASEVVEQLLGKELIPKMQTLLERLMETPSGSEEEEEALTEVIKFAKKHADFTRGPQTSKALQHAYSIVFQGNATRSMAAPGTPGRRMMDQIRKALPADTLIDIGGEERTAAQWIKHLQSDDLPAPMAFTALMSKLDSAPIASVEEENALKGIISFATEHPNDIDTAKLYRMLLIVFSNSFGRCLEDETASDRCLRMMDNIADYMPHGTSDDIAGDNSTLKEHAHQARAMVALRRASAEPIGSYGEERNARELMTCLRDGVDFKFGDVRFAERARQALMGIAGVNLKALNENGSGNRELAQDIMRFLGNGKSQKAKSAQKKAKSSRTKTHRHWVYPVFFVLIIGLAIWLSTMWTGTWARIGLSVGMLFVLWIGYGIAHAYRAMREKK